MAAHDHTREIITQLLSNMGSAREIRQYLKRYSDPRGRQFALIKVGGAVLRDELETLASSLSFLTTVGLMPVVIHGAGPQLDDAFDKAGIETVRKDGLRVTTADSLEVVRRTFRDANLALVQALDALDVKATPITSGVFGARFLDQDKYGLVGELESVDMTSVRASLEAHRIPVIAPLAETATGQILNVNSDTAAAMFIREAKPMKVVFLTATGGLLDGEGKIIQAINLVTDYEDLMAQDWLNGGMRLKLQEIASFLSDLPLTASVSMTRPAQLAKELYTHTGSGTLIRRGEEVGYFEAWDRVDQQRLQNLIEAAFGKSLVEGYFDRTKLYRAYISESYRAAAILSEYDGVPFLDKFSVGDEARGEGLGKTIWTHMCHDNPKLFWRSRRGNPINSFYFSESDGCLKSDEWSVFWRGLDDMAAIEHCAKVAMSLPPTVV